jgi:hypothetical protein
MLRSNMKCVYFGIILFKIVKFDSFVNGIRTLKLLAVRSEVVGAAHARPRSTTQINATQLRAEQKYSRARSVNLAERRGASTFADSTERGEY